MLKTSSHDFSNEVPQLLAHHFDQLHRGSDYIDANAGRDATDPSWIRKSF
jgi:hypothetical protein